MRSFMPCPIYGEMNILKKNSRETRENAQKAYFPKTLLGTTIL